MGGGNGLKSHMARLKNAEKKAGESKGGGGSAGIAERTQSKIGTSCAICKCQFTSIKMKQQLIDHQTTKHANSTFEACFPGVPKA